MLEVFTCNQILDAHENLLANRHAPRNIAVPVAASRAGLRTFQDVIGASEGPLG